MNPTVPSRSLRRSMEIEERRLGIDELTLGMFVSRLDRPWTETRFPLQGFNIDAMSQIEQLRRYCRHVYIDIHKSTPPGRRGTLEKLGYGSLTRRGRPLPAPGVYHTQTELADELKQAQAAWDDARALAASFVDDVRAGKRLSAEALGGAMEPIVASVIRNADAFFWLDALRKRDAYSYSHAVNCCALAASFGRHLGFPREMLVDLASAGMLMDIGKGALPEELLQRSDPISERERVQLRTHLDHSLSMLEQSGIRDLEITEMIRHHHERHDGSGYPAAIAGAKIPLTGRMLGLIDTFDALSSDRPHQKAMSRHDVLQYLYRQRDQLFQAELIEQFSQSLGVYPTGSLVELSNGAVAVVMAQNPARRLYPRVTILTHPDKRLDRAFPQVDLWALANAPDTAERVWIERALAPGAYGLDPTELYL
jgi:HD-GYP domain-containing protein (c-di-GMP phosphodiesterase class II)